MRTLFDTDEDEIEGKASEITLSTASLLGIFFGLVLVCGVFFGFGYSMGRGTGALAQAPPAPSSPPWNNGEAEEAAPKNPPAPAPAAQPVAKQQDDDEDETAAKAAPAAHPKVQEAPRAEIAQALRAAVPIAAETPAQLVTSKPAAGKVGPAYQPPAEAVATAAGQPMVQIAAVSRAQDADVLVAALRQRGYGVVVRSEPQDNLLHVQVGPFANRMQAAEIRQKLLSDGYNAIIKQ
ncbi:MAG: SPOR domain-containing protein [Acidobacteriaceae bacterium]